LAVRHVLEGGARRTIEGVRRAEAEGQAGRFVPVLDASQREAFVAAMAADPVTLIQGPPGTGKTYVLARIVTALSARGLRVLVTAHTHRAVNNALRMVAAADATLSVVKAGKASGADDLRGSRVGFAPSVSRLPTTRDPRRVVGATLFGLKAAWEEDVFDVAVVDEAAQIPLTFAPCAMLAAPRHILVGDHRQLGPIVQGRHGDDLAACSLFAHLAAAYPPLLLRTTYRMNAGLNDFPSRVFYDGLLAPEARIATARFRHVPGGPFDELFDPERPALLALVPHDGFRTRCPAEAAVVAGIVLDRIVRQRGDPGDIAVVSPYRAQLRLIRTLVKRGLDAAGNAGPLPVIDTVERIQGQEREMVVVSLVASDPDHLAGDAAGSFIPETVST
jgi:DNA replication ATP-dependent helicase Dna2